VGEKEEYCVYLLPMAIDTYSRCSVRWQYFLPKHKRPVNFTEFTQDMETPTEKKNGSLERKK